MLAYQRTYEKILEDLRNDVYPVNSLLPPEPKLEEIYHVSRTTVRRAIAQLADRVIHIEDGKLVREQEVQA